MKESRNKIVIFTLLALALLLIVGGILSYLLSPGRREVPFYIYFPEISPDSVQIVMGDKRFNDNESVIISDDIYFPVDFIRDFIDEYIFHEGDDIVITTWDKVLRFKIYETKYTVNNDEKSLNNAPLLSEGRAYLPSKFLSEFYLLNVSYVEQYNSVIIDILTEPRQQVGVQKSTPLRYEASSKSPIADKLTESQILESFYEVDGFLKVRTDQGLIGFAALSDLGKPVSMTPQKLPVEPVVKRDKVVMAWDLIGVKEANQKPEKLTLPKGVNVLSPTWFKFDAEALNGDIISIADKAYVDAAHQNGAKVWGLITDNFRSDVSHAVLTDTNIRLHVINQLLDYCDELGLDGINIDYENVRVADAPYYVQFLRELAPLMKQNGLILSVDMYVPKHFNLYYNRTEVAKSADYIVIMGYDEHHATSNVAGPVASILFVDEGVNETLKEAPPEKVILGLPFYSRVWREVINEGGSVTGTTSKSYGMNYTKRIFEEQGVDFDWNDYTASYFAEYEAKEDGSKVVYSTWLEDNRSLEEKLKLADFYDLAGVACWYRGLETPETWETIYSYFGM